MIKLIVGGEIYAPKPLGQRSIVIVADKVVHIGDVDIAKYQGLGIPVEVIDATGCRVTPGLVDPHAHLIGTGGEQGWTSRTPEVDWEDLVRAGVTTVVGCLGTDDTTRHLTSLLAKARGLQRQGISAYIYSGSFHNPGPTITDSVRNDLMMIPEVIGVGELAIADFRATEPTAIELAKLTSSALVGGLLGEKAGVIHFHVGEGQKRMQVLREVLEIDTVPARHFYPTHLNRSRALVEEGADLANRGSFVDMDTIELDLEKWIAMYLQAGGPIDRLSISSDANCPKANELKLREQLTMLLRSKLLTVEETLALATRTPAEALKLSRKGRIAPELDADLVVQDAVTHEVRQVIARGKVLLRDGVLAEVPMPDIGKGPRRREVSRSDDTAISSGVAK